jgi:hypothetical protein
MFPIFSWESPTVSESSSVSWLPASTSSTSNKELPVGTCFALLVTSPLVTRPFHNLPAGKWVHNLLQHACWVTLVPVGGYFSVFTLVTRPTGNASSYLIQKAI